MSARPVGRARPVGHVRRGRYVRRRSAGVSLTRAGGVLAMLASASLIYLAGTWDAFTVRHIDVVGASLTAGDEVRAAAGVGDGANVFALATDTVRGGVERLLTVASASVEVGLPDRLSIRIVERTPLLAWAVGTRRLLVDDDGRVFADLPADPSDARLARQLVGVPAIDDRRAAASGLTVGAALDPVDFEVARRLGALKPADVGSGASGLTVEVTDTEGFVVRPKAAGWNAVFGLYTPTLRPPTIVPGQVRLLASLLTGREAQVGRVLLASETDGTYEPRESPAASSP